MPFVSTCTWKGQATLTRNPHRPLPPSKQVGGNRSQPGDFKLINLMINTGASSSTAT